MKTISVIVPCRNERKHIEEFLDSLALQQIPADIRCEYLIADGMSDDGTREILLAQQHRFDSLQILDNPLRVASSALNEAVRKSRGEIIVRMDVHAKYAPDYVRQCVEVLEATGADNVGGPALARGTGHVQRAISLAYKSRFGCGGARFHDPNYEGVVDTVTFGCWRKKTLEQLGLFDEALIRNQDDELNLRLIRSGGKIWQTPKIRSWYFPRSTLRALAKQYAQYGYWKVRVIRKHRLPASWRHLVPPTFAATLLVLSLGAMFLPVPRLLLATVLGVYALTAVATSVGICRVARDWACCPVLPLVFCAYHLSYGIGFWCGVWDVLTRRDAAPAFSALVR